MGWDSEIDLLAGSKVEVFYIIFNEPLFTNVLIRLLQNRGEELVIKVLRGVQKLHQNLEGIILQKFVEDGGPMKVKNPQSILI